MKKTIRRYKKERIANLAAGVLAAVVLAAVIMTLCGNRFYVVRSGSMEPAIRTGAVAVVNRAIVYESVKEDDIICFEAGNGTPVLHRAVSITVEGITTKGDANRTADVAAVREDNYIGKVTFCVPYAGFLIGFLSSARGRILLLTAVAVWVILKVFQKTAGKKTLKTVAVLLILSLIVSGTMSGRTVAYAYDEVFPVAPAAYEELYGQDDEDNITEEKDITNGGIKDDDNVQTGSPETDSNTDNQDSTDPAPNEDITGSDVQDHDDGDEESTEGEETEQGEETESPDELSDSEAGGDSGQLTEDESGWEGEESPADPETGITGDMEESVPEEDEEIPPETDTVQVSVRAAAAEVFTATVRYRVNGGSIPINSSAKTQYAVGSDVGRNNTFVYKSTDYGATWSLLKTEVTTAESAADLENVGTIGIRMTGYRVTQTAAYNTKADQTGIVLCQNAGTVNPVTTKRLNGGEEITSNVTIDVYVNWQTTLVLDANGGAVWGEPSLTSVNAGTIYYGSSYFLVNRLSASDPVIDSTYLQTVPNFYREGYVFDGWNTVNTGISAFGMVYAPDTQLGRGGKVRIRQLIGDGSGGTGTTVLYARWIKREGVSGTQTLPNGAVITNEDHFGRNSITGTNVTIPYTVSGEIAADFSADTGSSDFVWQQSGAVGRFYYMRSITNPSSRVPVAGTLKLRLQNRAYDNVGRFYDVEILLSNIVLNPQRFGEFESYDAGAIAVFGYNSSTGLVTAYVDGGRTAGASYDIQIRILQHGTDTEATGLKTILYFQDLDSEDTSSMPGLNRYVLDPSGIAPYAEAITVPLETSASFYTKAGENFIIAKSQNASTRITGGEHTGSQSGNYGQITPGGAISYQNIPMSEQEYTAVIFPVTSGNINISWSGSNCGTSLFSSPASGSLKIVKMSAQETVTEGNSSYSLAGAEFGIYSDEVLASEAAANGAANGYELCVLTTDQTGETPDSQELTLGTYYIAEIKAPPGYRRRADVRTVVVAADGQKVRTEISDEPYMDTIGVLLRKTDEAGNEVREDFKANLSGAQFLIQYYPTVETGMTALEDELPVRSWVYETNAEGVVDFSDEELKISGDELYYDPQTGSPAVPAGILVIKEILPPPGFETDNRAFLLTIGFDESGAVSRALYDGEGNALEGSSAFEAGLSDVGLKIPEPVSEIELTIQKQIEKEDLLEEHGAVSFAFEVSGKDLLGKEHIFHQMISFEGEEEGRGLAIRSVTIKVPAGSYTIEELETDRFSLVNITSNTENLTVRVENCADPVGVIQPVAGSAFGLLLEDASVCFTNRKTDWEEFSHTTSAVNHFGGK